jgi:hypothetical protein
MAFLQAIDSNRRLSKGHPKHLLEFFLAGSNPVAVGLHFFFNFLETLGQLICSYFASELLQEQEESPRDVSSVFRDGLGQGHQITICTYFLLRVCTYYL